MKLEVKFSLYFLVFCFAIICFKLVYEGTHKTNYIKEDNKEIEIRESPNIDKIYKRTLLIEKNNLDKCIQKNNVCIFNKEFISYLNNQIKYYIIFDKIRNDYGEDSLNLIQKNKDLIELKLDESTTKNLLKINSNYLSLEDSRKKEIYYNYLKNGEIERLVNLKNNSKNPKEKAIFEYQIYLLFSDIKLYLN